MSRRAKGSVVAVVGDAAMRGMGNRVGIESTRIDRLMSNGATCRHHALRRCVAHAGEPRR